MIVIVVMPPKVGQAKIKILGETFNISRYTLLVVELMNRIGSDKRSRCTTIRLSEVLSLDD